jgi:hypothetical protein
MFFMDASRFEVFPATVIPFPARREGTRHPGVFPMSTEIHEMSRGVSSALSFGFLVTRGNHASRGTASKRESERNGDPS